MFAFFERLKSSVRTREYLHEFQGEIVDPPRRLNRRWFDEFGSPTDDLAIKIRWLEENMREIDKVENRIGNYFTIEDILVVGGQARTGGSEGDLDLFVWLSGTKRSLYMTSDESDMRLVVTAAINGLSKGSIREMINQTGEANFVDVFVSTVPPKKMRIGGIEKEEIYYSSRLGGWIKRRL